MNSYQLVYLAALCIPAQVLIALNFHLLTRFGTTFRSDVTHLILVVDVALLVLAVLLGLGVLSVPAILVYLWFYLGGIA